MGNLEKNSQNEIYDSKKQNTGNGIKKEYTPYIADKTKTEEVPNPEKAFDDFDNPIIDNDEMFDNSVDPKKKFDFTVEGDRIKVLQILGDYNQAKANKGPQLQLYYNKISNLLTNNQVDFQKIIEESANHMMAGVTIDNELFKSAIANKYNNYKNTPDRAILSDSTMQGTKWNTLYNSIFRKYGVSSNQFKVVSNFDDLL